MYNFNNGDEGLRLFVDFFIIILIKAKAIQSKTNLNGGDMVLFFFIKYLQQEVNVRGKQLLDGGADIFKSEFLANKNVLVVVDISSQYCDIYYNFIMCKDKSFIDHLVVQLSRISS